jgi:O-Antigen ligase
MSETTVGRTVPIAMPSSGALVRALAFTIAFVPLVALAGTEGGYFPAAWAWATFAFAWLCGLSLLLRSAIVISSAERVFMTAWVALTAWIGLSALWSDDVPQTVLELERTLVYSAAVVTFAVVLQKQSARWLLGGALAAISAVSAFSIATRLFPGHLRIYDPAFIYRLAQPIGYWNALSLFTAIGALLALGFAARGRTVAVRAASAAVLLLLLPTFYFTFGRAGWIALAAGFVLTVAIDPRRLQFLVTILIVTPAVACAIWVASRSEGLTREGASVAQAAHDGHRYALVVVALALLNGLLVAAASVIERRVRPSRRTRTGFAALVAAVALGGLVVVFVRFGSPPTLVDRAWSAFKAPPPHVVNLNRRLTNFSGNGRYDLWRLAWDNARGHRLAGTGAGTYERYFLAHQPAGIGRVKDAHGLYIETLSELGVIGLVLLVVAVGVPLVAALQARGNPIVPAAAGAYTAFLAHAFVDWDWEVPAVMLAGLVCAVAVLLVTRQDAGWELPRPGRAAGIVGAALVGVFAAIGLVGYGALNSSDGARGDHRWEKAIAEARTAASWLPWSPRPWAALGQAQLGAGEVSSARASFKKALTLDSSDWELWYLLSTASHGRERAQALRQVRALFPRSGVA